MGRWAASSSPAASSMVRALPWAGDGLLGSSSSTSASSASASGGISISTARALDRTGPARSELVEGLVHCARDVLCSQDSRPPLGDGTHDVELVVDLVQDTDVATDVVPVDLARDHQNGRRSRVSGAYRRRRVLEPWTGHDHGRANGTAGPGVPVGHIRRGLLVPGRDEGDIRLVVEGIEGVVELDSRQPENDADALAMDRPYEGLTARHSWHRTPTHRRGEAHSRVVHGETRDARDHLGSTGRALGTDRTYHPGEDPSKARGRKRSDHDRCLAERACAPFNGG